MGTLAIASAVPFALGGGIGRAIAALFSQSEKGVWYDPSDLTSMFQDSAGTTAAVVGQPVGLVLDKSRGLVLGPELVTNGGFDNGSTAGWAAVGTTVVSASSGGIRIQPTVINEGATQTISTVVGKRYKVTLSIVSGSAFRIFAGSTAQAFATVGEKQFVFTATGATTEIRLSNSEAPRDIIYDNISVRELPGYHATQSTSTARPILRQSGSLYYLEFDGVDDFLVTSDIDFSGTDKMSVFAGVLAAKQLVSEIICDFGTGGNTIATGATLYAKFQDPNMDFVTGITSAGPLYSQASFGTDSANGKKTLVTSMDFAGTGVSNELSMRVNATTAPINVPALNDANPAGNFGNYPIYIGMRAGTSLPFNGHLYSLVVRGALSDASQIAAAESYVNSKTGAY